MSLGTWSLGYDSLTATAIRKCFHCFELDHVQQYKTMHLLEYAKKETTKIENYRGEELSNGVY